MPGQIVAIGGGGCSTEPPDALLDRYVLGLAGRENPRVLFIPTASGDSQDYIVRFYSAFTEHPCRPGFLSLLRPPTADLRSLVLEQDVVYVGGGNTKNLVALWREWELDGILREGWEQGMVLAGVSAGAICWYEEGITDSIPGALTPLKCLGFLKGSCCPHFDGEPERRPSFHRLLSEGRIGPGYAADDGAALHYSGTELVRCVASRPNARVYRLERDETGVRETPLETTYLG